MRKLIHIAIVLTGLTTSLGAQMSLLENSPFVPPRQGGDDAGDAGSASQSLSQLEFRGVTAVDGEYIFSIYNRQTRESRWLSEGAEEDGLLIRSWDANKMSIVIYSVAEDMAREIPILDFSMESENPVAANTSGGHAAPPPPGTVTPSGDPNEGGRPARPDLRPTRRNLETLRQRRQELADRLKKRAEDKD